jgi:hypothetical protein
MKVSAALKGRPDSMGRVAVSIRIASGKIRRFKAIQPPIRILPKQFKDGRVINHPDKDLFNLRIKEAIKLNDLEALTNQVLNYWEDS